MLDNEYEDVEGRRESLESNEIDSWSDSNGGFGKFIIGEFSSGKRRSGGNELKSTPILEKSMVSWASFLPSQTKTWLANTYRALNL